MYTGSTNSFERRMKEHVDATNNSKNQSYNSSHYEVARHARASGNTASIILCRLDWMKSEGHKAFRDVVEQAFISAFGCFSDRVLRFETDPADDEYVELDVAASFSNRIFNKIIANSLDVCAAAAQTMPRWPGGCSRVGQNAFGASRGVNIVSPLYTFHDNRDEKMVWTRLELDLPGFGKITNYRRGTAVRAIIREKSTVTQLLLFGIRGLDDNSSVYCYGNPGDEDCPPEGAELQVVFEVAPDGKEHPLSYARVPAIGPFRDWSQANRLALRIEWKDNEGKWHYKYFQRRKIMELKEGLNNPTPGALNGYCVATGLLRCFQKQHRLTNNRPDHYNLGLARVIPLTFNDWTQTLRFEAEIPVSDAVWDNRPVSHQELVGQMIQAGLENVDGPYG